MTRVPTLRYRSPLEDGSPPIGTILMDDGPRVRRAYRILNVVKTKTTLPGLGVCTWKLQVEPMSAASGRTEIEAGAPYWCIKWDKRRAK